MRNSWTGLALILGTSTVVFARPVAGSSGADDDARSRARVELGRRLFFEPEVSRGGRVSCASCHDPAHGFTDTAHPSVDEWGFARRRTMPLTDLTDGPLHSDGEFAALRDLLDARLAPLALLRSIADEKGVRRPALAADKASFPSSYGASKGDPPALMRVSDRLAADRFYASAFADAFGDDAPTHDRICDAVEAYLRTLRTSPSPFDRFLAGDDTALAAPAVRGLAVFHGKAGCAQCHDTRPVDGRAPLRDGKFHDTGIALRTARAEDRRDAFDRADAGRGALATDAAEKKRDHMRFKTPSLRDVAKRGPFMHDGSLATLVDVVEHYDAGGVPHDGQDPLLHKLGLTAAEKDDLVAFLFALSGAERAGLADAPSRERTMRVRVVDPSGAPVAGLSFEAVPAGDRLGTAAPAPAPVLAKTDKDGRAQFAFPETTHVRLAADGYGFAGLVPDCAQSPEIIAVPATKVALRVRAAPKMLPTSVRATPISKAAAKGEIVAERDGDTMEFALVRKLSDAEAIYVAPAPAGGPASSRRFLGPDGSRGGALPAVVDVDLRGGATSGADLTPKAHADDASR